MATLGTVGWWAQRFELSRGGAASNLLAMEGLRGLAVLFVFGVHYASLVQPWLSHDGGLAVVFDAVHRIGHAGVDLFFVLSGYLIYGHLITAKPAFGRYFARRLRRIYPVFLTVFAVYLLLSWLRPGDSKLPADNEAASLLVLQNLLLLPGILPIEAIITVAWSLSYEMFYYLLMPALIALLMLRGRSPEWRLRFFIGMTAVALAGFALAGGPVRLVMFLAGVVLFEALPRWRAPGSGLAAAVVVLSLAVTWVPMPGPAGQALRTAVLYVGFFTFCFACFARPQQPMARAFCWTPLRWLGNMSYSYYLIHGLCLKALFVAVGKVWPPQPADPLALALLVPALGLTWSVAALLFVGVERPFSLRIQPVTLRRAALAG